VLTGCLEECVSFSRFVVGSNWKDMFCSMKVLLIFALFAFLHQSAYAKKRKRGDFYSTSFMDNKATQKAAGRNQMEEAMKMKLPNFKVKDVPKTTTSETGKVKKMMADKLPNFKVSTPAAAPAGGTVPVLSPVLAVQSPVLSVSNSAPTKEKKKMGKDSTAEPSGPTAIPTSPTTLSVPTPTPPSKLILAKTMTKSGSGMAMSKSPPILALPTDLPSATPVPSDTIPSASPVPSNNVSTGMGKMK
jgi:hypothetical protein